MKWTLWCSLIMYIDFYYLEEARHSLNDKDVLEIIGASDRSEEITKFYLHNSLMHSSSMKFQDSFYGTPDLSKEIIN